jgi:prepilin-type N-terminal cleavage/methylation domain-containing protein
MKRSYISSQRKQAGMSLIEMMIAMVVLAVGVLGMMAMMTTAISTNGATKQDTGSTMLAQMVLEQIASIPANNAPQLPIQDCRPAAPQVWFISTAGGALPVGAGAALTATGEIDWLNQNYAAVPNGYKMLYVGCATGGTQVVYDVRWNVMVLPDNFTKLITVSARPAGASNPGAARLFARPVTLRTIGGI